MSIRVCQNSFSKGILSPSLYGRTDLEQYSLGLKKINNGFILQEGCMVNRPGLEYLATTKYKNKKSRLIPFNFATNQNFVIELGDCYIRFLKDGAYILDNSDNIYELTSPYSENDLFEIDYVQQADVITLVHKSYAPRELARIANDNWTLTQISFAPSISAPTNVSASYSGSTSSNTTTYNYVVCAVDATTNEESARSSNASVTGHLEAYWLTSEYITISWSAVSGASEYNIYRAVNGIYGYIGTSSTTSFIDNNIEPDLTTCAPITKNPFANENPSTVCYFQQRKIYASSTQSPQTLWASQAGTNNNFNISRPLSATDAVTLSIYDNAANVIQHLIPFNDLIAVTTNAEWAINGSEGVFSANPTPVASIQSCYGSAKIKPIVSGSMVLFVQSGGNILRNLGYNYFSDSYDGEELTLFANHLFQGKQIVDMAYSKEPYRILWCIMDDGTINALTYNPSQKIAAWHTHSTQGKFESVTTIRENNEDIAYFVVNRTINDETVRYIERFKTRTVNDLENCFFLDCALKQTFTNKVSSISGLTHLKNMNVCALLDYGVVENLTVDASGNVSLPYKANNILIGLPYEFEFETLNIDTDESLGINKVINKIELKIIDSREDFFVVNSDNTLSQNARCHESINYPKKLFSKGVQFCPLSNPTCEATVKIKQKYPLPLNIISIATTISLEDVEAK